MSACRPHPHTHKLGPLIYYILNSYIVTNRIITIINDTNAIIHISIPINTEAQGQCDTIAASGGSSWGLSAA